MPAKSSIFVQNPGLAVRSLSQHRMDASVTERNRRGQEALSGKQLAQGGSNAELRSPSSQTSGKPVLTVLIADDHPLVREGLVALINRQPDMRVVAEASNGLDAVEQFLAHRPEVALLDLRMPSMDGVEAAAAICERRPDAKIAIVSSYQSEEEVYRSMRAGAQGYVLKDSPAKELIECIHALAESRTWIPPGVGAKLARRVTGRELTPREIEVLRSMAAGKSNKEIGVMLDITESTVKVHVTHLLEKLKAGGRTEAVSTAFKRGLVALDPAQS